MVRTFEPFQQLFDFGERGQSKIYRLHLKWFSRRPLRGQPSTQQSVHNPLERLPRLADFFVDEDGDIVIERKRGSHIMMLYEKTS
jgi:hypothetical protein